ncbi:23S rRNA (pseudouridine(1915)-N(3))-methyltransferase RlmH [Enterovirga sp.]|uniref:23S rRNA (pseudouridine(1915)-N(3))-methyltransferase RlmH n=1 Tax=Enterovirga sp. TaxID=2026350 RepID=UPI00262496C7|nr:23S rRNA (pseudouridine(1915)-N(3))-methyltransferase RlmH [Enterovirga sp.]
MRVRILAIGRLKSGPERDLVERYRTRCLALGRGLGFAGPDLVEIPEGRARRDVERRADEALRLRERAGGAQLLLLDEAAPAMTSEAFAGRLAELRDAGQPDLALVIGGPDGFDPDFKRQGAWSVSFGRFTLPHQLVRVLATEQLYRAFTIIAGHPYHRAGDEGGA